MTSTDVVLMQQLKEAGKLLSWPPDSVDELLHILDQVEKLLSMVEQSPNDSMQEALKPSVKALVKERLLRHSNVDVKVAVASCISEITRITAPDAPYNDEEMRGVFQLIVSSFENLSDKSSRSYNKRASILETVSKVRSCVIMLDLECEELIVDMFEHFLKSVRDHHSESVFSSMMNIMVLVLEESEDVSVVMLKPLLNSIKNNSEGVLPVARKLGEGVLRKSAAKLRPFLIQALRSLGDSLDNYSQVLASVCEGTIAAGEDNDENALAPLQVVESKMAKESSDEARQAGESKLTMAISDVAKVVIEKEERPLLGELDPTSNKSPKSVMSNGILVTGSKEASADQESSKKPDEAIDHPDSKVNANDSVADKLESKPEQTDTAMNSAEPSVSSHGEKQAEKLPDNEISSFAGKESSIQADIPSETEKSTPILISVPKEIESEVENAPASKRGSPKKGDLLKNNQVLPQEEEVEVLNAASPSQNGSLLYESCIKKSVRSKSKSKKKNLSQDGAPLIDVLEKTTEDTGKHGKKKTPVAQEDEVTSGSDVKLLKPTSKKVGIVDSGAKSEKQLGKGKKVGAGDPPAKNPKQSDKKIDAGELEAKKRKRDGKREDESDSDAKPLRRSAKKGEKSGVIINPSGHTTIEVEGSDLESAPLNLLAKKSNTMVKFSSKKHKNVKGHGSGKNVEEKDDAKSLSDYDGMDISPKSAGKSAKGEGNLEDALPTNSKRKRSMGKDKGMDTSPKPTGKSTKREGSLDEALSTASKQKRSIGKDKGMDISLKSTGKSAREGSLDEALSTISKRKQSMGKDKGMDISPKPTGKLVDREGNLAEARSTASKKKGSMVKDKGTETIKYDDSLVGLKVKVWWPKDKTYYEGVVESFDSTKQKHQVLYLDGEIEILNLKRQKWEILQEFSTPEEKISEFKSVSKKEEEEEEEGRSKANGGSVKEKELKSDGSANVGSSKKKKQKRRG